MANIVRTVIQFRRDTSANWESHKDVIPAPGEPCFEIDTGILKIGDGKTPYCDLVAIGGKGSVALSADGSSIILEDGVFKLAGFDSAKIGAQPRKVADGKIEWVVPSEVNVDDLKKTVDALDETVDGLETDVESLQTEVTDLKAIVGSADDGSGTLLSRIEGLEFQMDGTGEGTVDSKIDAKIDELFELADENGKVDTIKELFKYVEDHGNDFDGVVNDLAELKGLVGSKSVHDQITEAVANSGHISKAEAMDTLLSKVEAKAIFERVKYEVSHKPVGTLVDYRDKEIRVMVPADTQFEHQTSGENSDANAYYIGFKAYAPDGAVSFKEDLTEIIADNTMYSFEGNEFAGIDAYDRKYSIVWLPVANYADGVWTYYGSKSSTSGYIGWYYSVEWYDANGKKIASDCIRINLSNENCHNNVEPFYMGNVVKEVTVNGTLFDVVDGKVDIVVPEIKESDEIAVNEDGSLSIKTISFDKIAQGEDNVLIMDGGSAV